MPGPPETAAAPLWPLAVYGAAVLIALLYHLLLQDAPPIFWAYAVVDGVFLVPIVYIWLGHERTRIRPS